MKLSSITYYLKDTGKEEQTVYINIAVGGARTKNLLELITIIL